MRGAGALVFLIVFFVSLLATIAMPDIPPGKQIYGALGVAETDYSVLGVSATSLIEAIFNGVVYGIIAWLIFTLGSMAIRRKPQTQQPAQPQQTQTT
jgi:threonine/homoserine/homoserine lactone efflux protein